MEQERLQRAMELFEVPEEFYEVSQLMVKEAEWELILAMGKEVVFESELKKRIRERNWRQMLRILSGIAIIGRLSIRCPAEKKAWIFIKESDPRMGRKRSRGRWPTRSLICMDVFLFMHSMNITIMAGKCQRK